jgi:peptide deformylase
MAIRKVARMGHPVLRQKARDLTPAEIRAPETRQLIEDMIETMEEYGGIGLAAPQVHEPIRLALIGYDGENARYPDSGDQPLTVIFNPQTTVLDEKKQGFWEGCLSVPELRGLVHRPRKIQIDYLDESAKPQRIVAEGFLATVFQHELDHLDGVLYVDRIQDRTKFAFTEEYDRYWAPAADDDVGELAD